MRQKDQEKLSGKALKTINFDKHVLAELELKAKRHGTTVSALVNTAVRQVILTDKEFYTLMAKHHYLKFQEFHYMKEQQELQILTKIEERT